MVFDLIVFEWFWELRGGGGISGMLNGDYNN